MKWAPLILLLALVVPVGSCAHRPPIINPALTSVFTRQITLYQRPLDVNFARPRHAASGLPLLVYATGDGGFHGNDREVFEELASFGYPVAGFSARTYLKNLTYISDTTTPARLARDYERLIEFSKRSLELPVDTPVILVGVSRGAGLEVVAAGQGLLRNTVQGVLAIALTQEEEYVQHYRLRRGKLPPGTPRRELVMIETYEYLTRLAPIPISVIQSTNDNYLPAAKARDLFGPDTWDKQFHAIDARNHSFSGARDELYREMESSLGWLRSFPAPAPRARQ